jgi:hypothetical protein
MTKIERERADKAFEKLKQLRTRTTLGGLSWKALRDEGREPFAQRETALARVAEGSGSRTHQTR